MALVLGAQVGDTFYFGRRRIAVTSVDSVDQVTVERDDGRIFKLNADMAAELFRDVFVTTAPREGARGARLVFDAPQTIIIARGQ